jgi:hypothetical protein
MATFWRTFHHGKICPGWEESGGGGGARSSPFTIYAITYKVVTLFLVLLYPYCTLWQRSETATRAAAIGQCGESLSCEFTQFASTEQKVLDQRVGAHSPAAKGVGESHSDDWRKSLALCLLSAPDPLSREDCQYICKYVYKILNINFFMPKVSPQINFLALLFTREKIFLKSVPKLVYAPVFCIT